MNKTKVGRASKNERAKTDKVVTTRFPSSLSRVDRTKFFEFAQSFIERERWKRLLKLGGEAEMLWLEGGDKKWLFRRVRHHSFNTTLGSQLSEIF